MRSMEDQTMNKEEATSSSDLKFSQNKPSDFLAFEDSPVMERIL